MAPDLLAKNLTPSGEIGHTSQEAAVRRAEVGANVLPEGSPTPWWMRVLRQLHDPIIYILLFALAFDWRSSTRPVESRASPFRIGRST